LAVIRILGAIICLVVIALSAGAIYQSIVGNVDETRYKPPGRLVDIGGRRLHLYCTGSESPTVILEAGLGWGVGTWRRVRPKVAETTRYGDPAMDAVYSSNKSCATPIKELAVVATSTEEVRKARLALGDRPLIVLTAACRNGDESWQRMQLSLLMLSSNSRRIVVEGSGHRIQSDRPDVVVDAIRDVVQKSRRP
jgi:pimeloyl-ACP methyl ester carboxylesterase